jgi:DNA-binding MarR family transcriptional regulator
MELTKLEKIVYASIKNECKTEYCSDVKIVSEDTGLKVNVVKGVVGSLVKKGFVDTQTEERDNIVFNDLFAIVDGELWSYAIENELC